MGIFINRNSGRLLTKNARSTATVVYHKLLKVGAESADDNTGTDRVSGGTFFWPKVGTANVRSRNGIFFG